MKVLARSKRREPIVHIAVTNIDAIKYHALCSPRAKYPYEGAGDWGVREETPDDIICSLCQARYENLNAPLEQDIDTWNRLSERERRFYENWESWHGARHKDDPRGENDEEKTKADKPAQGGE
jgi:hypothetical protein